MFVVPDSHKDPRFCDNELVTGPPYVRFYAGAALKYEGVKVGSFCIIDHVPREFSERDRQLLKDMKDLVVGLLETRRRHALEAQRLTAQMNIAVLHALKFPLVQVELAHIRSAQIRSDSINCRVWTIISVTSYTILHNLSISNVWTHVCTHIQVNEHTRILQATIEKLRRMESIQLSPRASQQWRQNLAKEYYTALKEIKNYTRYVSYHSLPMSIYLTTYVNI